MIIDMIRPDDWHVHFRDNELLPDTVNATASTFMRALAMPNLTPALVDVPSLLTYRQRLLNVLPAHSDFQPFLTLYLQESTDPQTLIDAKQHPFILGAKLYPANATTHSSTGVHSIKALYPLLDLMQSLDLGLQIHGEDTKVDIFDREASFIQHTLIPLTQQFPKLRVVLEHISTKIAADFVMQAPSNVAATITPQHLLYDRNDLLSGGIKPHLYCLPILKTAQDKQALLNAAFSGNPKFFAGTDSAPHAINNKESACGCAGTYSAPVALALYAEIFDKHDMLSHFESFMSKYGASFYQLPFNIQRITLKREAQCVPPDMSLGKQRIIPIKAGEWLSWRIAP